MKQFYTQLTEASLRELMQTLTAKTPESKREYVMLTGQTGMFMFHLAMKGIKLPDDVKYTYTTYKKLHNILYISIGKKHDLTKIKVDMNNATYTAMLGTKIIGTSLDVNKAAKMLEKYIK